MPDERATKTFNFVRMFVKDLSFETPMGAEVFAADWNPDHKVKLEHKSHRLSENIWEVILIATVTANLGDKTAYMIEAHHGAIVEVTEMEREPLSRVLTIDVPNIMFPYLREAVDNVAVKGGFPPVGMSRPDFDAWFMQTTEQLALQAGKP